MTETILLRDSAPVHLEQAAAENHHELFRLGALATGGEVKEADGVTWTYARSKGDSMVAFPHLPDDRAGAQLDEIIAFYLLHRPKGLVGCWSLDPPQPRDLGSRLLARGFQPGWQPRWMALDLDQMIESHPAPEELRIEEDRSVDFEGSGIPFTGEEANAWAAMMATYPGRVRRFVAWLGDRPVGNSAVILTEGPFGVAGIYDVGVAEDVRNRGIGKAVTLASCRWAREKGYHYALLNATGPRMYEQIGFQVIGYGQTWWLNVPRLAAHPPTPDQIALGEAIGRGDVEALEGLRSRFSVEDLMAPMTNEMSLMQLAVDCGQPASAEWLAAQGVPLRPLEAWDLGWKDRAAQLLSDDPQQVNHRYGDWQVTLLHEAVSRGDVELARLALSARPDLELQDTAYQSTPLGWAKHFGNAEIARLIQEHQAA